MRWALIAVALGIAGCNVLFGFDEIQPNVDASTDAKGNPPNVYSSPGPRRHSIGYDYVKPVTVTLAADDPTTVIYYTTDGTTPSLGSQHTTTPIKGISIAAGTLAYFGVSSGGTSAVISDLYYVDATKQSVAGYHVTDVLLDGTSPVVVVSAGQVLAGATARAQGWVQGACAACAAQIVYGVDTTDQGCLYDGGPGVYPGVMRTATFSITAPTTPGIHIVRITHSEQTSCASAMSMNSLVTRPDLSRIGVLIVR